MLTCGSTLHGKRWMVMAGLFLLSAGLVILIRATSPDVPPVQLEFIFAFMFIPQAILPCWRWCTLRESCATSRKSRR